MLRQSPPRVNREQQQRRLALHWGEYHADAMPWELYKAEQQLKCVLTEKGAHLQVKVEIGEAPFGEPPPPPPTIPRFFHDDRPFFIFPWRDHADWPYFGAWLGNGAPMVKFDPR